MKFKIGQRVIITSFLFFGITGTIIGIDDPATFGVSVLIKTDKKFHNLLNKKGYKLNLHIQPSQVKLLSTKRIEVE